MLSPKAVRIVGASLPRVAAYHATANNSAMSAAKAQPWKAFWPPNKNDYTVEQQEKMPWLTWKPDPNRPDDKPWRKWMLAEQSTVVRRGSSW